ncbi:hypothetical protein M422DRAFT_257041 [Sphaerobolus stellatus SS14]|uniref:Uncharacterized protein n=1 Tax=Sphaerobolus stellatus (strain SS14) TaxID=990650 RepID=A0A0C9UAN6_SPHS4|nr:hypothetical protein M422DRAFT_257041 [Sphaerobolus stellatus SS14]
MPFLLDDLRISHGVQLLKPFLEFTLAITLTYLLLINQIVTRPVHLRDVEFDVEATQGKREALNGFIRALCIAQWFDM